MTPVISVSALIPAGAINDKDKSGLASLTATALKHGTKNFTKAKLDEELDFIGANVSTYASKEYFPPTLQLKIKTIIKEVLLNPVLTLPNLKKEKQVIG
jgi:predicted Zn-dependent peptidase